MGLREGYKKTEIGIIPEDWEVKKLGEIGAFKKGKGIKKDEVVSYGLPCVRYGELYTHHSEYIKEFNSHINSETAKNSQLIKKNDILFAGSGETKEEIGKCASLIDDIEAYAGGDVIILTPKESNSLFLGFLLNNRIVAKQKAQQAQGDAVVHIYPRNLSNIKIPLPPLPEQKAIAEVLSDTDNLIEALEKRIAKKRLIRQGAMQKLLTPKENWEVKKMIDISPLQRGFDLPNKNLQKGIYPVVYSNGILNYHNKLQAKAPGIVTGRSGTIGKVTFVEKDYWPHNTALWVTDFKNNVPKYIYYLYSNIKLERFATGSGVPTLNRNDVHNFEVAIPKSKQEQTRIAAVLSDMDSEIETLEKKLAKCKQLKQGLMQNLLTGNMRLI